MRLLGVDTMVVFDTHWLVNTGYHGASRTEGPHALERLITKPEEMPKRRCVQRSDALHTR